MAAYLTPLWVVLGLDANVEHLKYEIIVVWYKSTVTRKSALGKQNNVLKIYF